LIILRQPRARQRYGAPGWATEKLEQAAVASARLGLKAHATFSGSLAWPFFYPWPPHNEQRFQEAFASWHIAGGRFWIPLTTGRGCLL
jgi:hypothetical protein